MFAFLVQKVNKIFSACCYFNRMPTAKINLSCARLFCGEMAKISETNGQFHCGPFLEKHNMPHISCLCSILISSLVAFPQKKIRNAQALKIISGPDGGIKKRGASTSPPDRSWREPTSSFAAEQTVFFGSVPADTQRRYLWGQMKRTKANTSIHHGGPLFGTRTAYVSGRV
jgi:hypothetical protein